MQIIPQNIKDLLDDFSQISDVREKFEFLIELAEDLEDFPESQKTIENKIAGCASDAWVVVSSDSAHSTVKISGTGDAVISKGILSFFIKCFEGLSAQEILLLQKTSPSLFIDSGVISSLSPSRANGARAMLEKIYNECKQHLI